MFIKIKLSLLFIAYLLVPSLALSQGPSCQDDISGPNQNTDPITIYVYNESNEVIDSLVCNTAGGSNNIYCDLSNLPPDAFYLSFDGSCKYTPDGQLSYLPLSVGLLHFEAIKEGHANVINWTTESELNNDYFTVERSENAQNWQILGYVDGAGTTEQTLSYSLGDNSPYNPITYYRLKQTDFDGEFSYSQVVAINSTLNPDGDFIASMFPNPSTKFTTFMFNGNDTNTPLMINVIDELGQVVNSRTYTSLYKGMLSTMNTNGLAAGMYHLEFTQGEHQQIEKLTIIN